MDEDMFVYKSYCELVITSDTISPDVITNELGLVPDRKFYKGDERTSKHTSKIIVRQNNLWALRSKTIISNDEDVSILVKHLYILLNGKLDLLRGYKYNPALEVVLWFWIETDNAGIGFQFTENELSWVNEIANRVQFSLITKDTISLE